MLVKVKEGIKDGFFGYHNHKRVKPGETFDIEESQFSSRWMEKVEEDKPVRKPFQRKEDI